MFQYDNRDIYKDMVCQCWCVNLSGLYRKSCLHPNEHPEHKIHPWSPHLTLVPHLTTALMAEWANSHSHVKV